MRVIDRRHKVIFSSRVTTRDDLGQQVVSWMYATSVMCSMDFEQGAESAYKRDIEQSSVTITFRPALNIDTGMRAELYGIKYNVGSVKLMSRTKMQVQLIQVTE